jgi:hypothetical protein
MLSLGRAVKVFDVLLGTTGDESSLTDATVVVPVVDKAGSDKIDEEDDDGEWIEFD